jgi:hypothetical protein
VKRRRTHIFEKEANGWYVEPPWCSARLFDVEDFGERSRTYIWDPACGGGNILKSARAHHYKVLGSDIVRRTRDQTIGFERVDFLNGAERRCRYFSVVCNPPFDHVEDFCRRALELGAHKVAMLMLLRRLPAARWLATLPLDKIYLLTPRPSMPPGQWLKAGNKPGGGTQDFVWLVFDNGKVGRIDIDWLHRDRA